MARRRNSKGLKQSEEKPITHNPTMKRYGLKEKLKQKFHNFVFNVVHWGQSMIIIIKNALISNDFRKVFSILLFFYGTRLC